MPRPPSTPVTFVSSLPFSCSIVPQIFPSFFTPATSPAALGITVPRAKKSVSPWVSLAFWSMKADNRPPPSTPLSTSPLPGVHIVLKTPPLEGLPPEEEWVTPMTVQVTWHSFLPLRLGRKEDISFKNFTLSVGRLLWPRQGQPRKPIPVDKPAQSLRGGDQI